MVLDVYRRSLKENYRRAAGLNSFPKALKNDYSVENGIFDSKAFASRKISKLELIFVKPESEAHPGFNFRSV